MDTPLGSVLYITLGCAKNEVDTDRMRSLLTAAGYEEAFDPQDADIAIVNTCSFLASATSEIQFQICQWNIYHRRLIPDNKLNCFYTFIKQMNHCFYIIIHCCGL